MARGPVRPGDQVLFRDTAKALRLLDATLNNEHTLRFLITGRDELRGYVMQWLLARFSSPPSAASEIPGSEVTTTLIRNADWAIL